MMKRRRGRAKSLPLSTRKVQASSRNMTTRRAASKAATDSTGGSTTSGDSRRSSLADSTHVVGGDDIDSRRPAKRARRTSTVTERRLSTRGQQATSQELLESPHKAGSSAPSVSPDPPHIEKPEIDDGPVGQSVMNGGYDGFASEAGEKLSPLPPKRRGRKPKPKPVTASMSRMQELAASWDQGNGTDREASNVPSRATSRAPSRAPSRVAKRMPGRRRAPHADPNIEADLRRQLQLRLGYRAVAKALKPLLAELSQRSIDALEDDEEAHQRGEEYTAVMAELDSRLQKRLEILEHERRIKTDSRQEWFELQKEELRLRFVNRVEVLQDDYQTQAENRLLELRREYEREIDEDATEDEDGVVGPQHGKTSNANPTGKLGRKHASRSRFFLVTEKLADVRQNQMGMQKLQKAFTTEDHDDDLDELDIPTENEYPSGFGLASISRRDYATSVLNLKALARASETVVKDDERKERAAQIIPNEDATGLQALAEAMDAQPLPAMISTRMQTPPPILVKQEPTPTDFKELREGEGNVVDLPTPQKQAENHQETHQLEEGNKAISITSPQMGVKKVEQNAAPDTVVSPTKREHHRKKSRPSSSSAPETQKPAVAEQPAFQIPGLQAPEDIPQLKQPAPPHMQETTASPDDEEWILVDVSGRTTAERNGPKGSQNGDAPTSVTEEHMSPKHSDRQPDAQSAPPPAAVTICPDPISPYAFKNAQRSPAPAAPASRWDNLYEQTRQGSRNNVENGRRHDSQAKSSHDRWSSESVHPAGNQHGDANQANNSAHRRDPYARVSTPVSFLTRSQSPMISDPGRRATPGYTNPLITDLGPTLHRTGSPSSGSQSAVEKHPPPGSWQGGQHRHSQSASSRAFSPPPPNHRIAPPGPYPPSSGPAYQTHPQHTAGPPYSHPLSIPQGHYSVYYQGQIRPGPPVPAQYQQSPTTTAAQYDHRPPNPFLPPQPTSYSGAPPYQTSRPPGYYSPGPPPPPNTTFSPHYPLYSLGALVSTLPPPSQQSGTTPPAQEGPRYGEQRPPSRTDGPTQQRSKRRRSSDPYDLP